MTKRAIEHLRADPVMAGLIDRIGPIPHTPRRVPPFHSLAQSIVYQQLNSKAAGTIFTRFLALFGAGGFPSPDAVLRLDAETFRSVGLSRQKTGYILDLAQRAGAGLLPSLEECDAMTDEELIARLTAVKGIGRWTAEMMLIFNLGRPDVLPVDDLGVRRGFQLAHCKRKMPEPDALARHGKRWAPFRTAAALYLWRAAELPEQ